MCLSFGQIRRLLGSKDVAPHQQHTASLFSSTQSVVSLQFLHLFQASAASQLTALMLGSPALSPLTHYPCCILLMMLCFRCQNRCQHERQRFVLLLSPSASTVSHSLTHFLFLTHFPCSALNKVLLPSDLFFCFDHLCHRRRRLR